MHCRGHSKTGGGLQQTESRKIAADRGRKISNRIAAAESPKSRRAENLGQFSALRDFLLKPSFCPDTEVSEDNPAGGNKAEEEGTVREERKTVIRRRE